MNLFLKICHRIRRRQSHSGSFSFKTVIDNLSTCRVGKMTEKIFFSSTNIVPCSLGIAHTSAHATAEEKQRQRRVASLF